MKYFDVVRVSDRTHDVNHMYLLSIITKQGWQFDFYIQVNHSNVSYNDVDNIDNIYTVCQLRGKGVAV